MAKRFYRVSTRALKAETTLERLPARCGANESRFLVRFQGELVGLVTKFHETPTETHPWKAFGRDYGSATQCNRILGFFYGGCDAAVRAVLVDAGKDGAA